MTESVLTGGCACGAVRYEYAGELLFAVNCHCKDCQRETGSAYAPILGVTRAGFRVTKGTPRYFDTTAESGHIARRKFCGDCGCRLFGEPGSAPHMITIRAASLDDPTLYRPTLDIYTECAQPWDYMNPQLRKSPRMPPRRS
jgi:hypothetical protein